VNHSRIEYVRRNTHANNIEAFWSLLKRDVVGTFHQVSKEYLPLYLAEFRTATITGRIQTSLRMSLQNAEHAAMNCAQMKYKAKIVQLRLPMEVSYRRLNPDHSSR